MEQSIIIIGAGVGGLSAGCYARMNGYSTTILEMAETPGGLCTSWRRKGYLFDGSVAGLAGTLPGSPLFRLWEEIGVARYCPLYYGENFGRIRLLDGRIITIYTNIDRLETHLLENFPLEIKPIREFTDAIRAALNLDIPFSDKQGWQAIGPGLKVLMDSLVHLPVLLKYGTLTINQFNRRIKDPALVTVLNNIVHFGGGDVPLLTVLLPLAYAHRRMAGIPQKGWLAFAQSIERRFMELGGKVLYNQRVDRLIIEHETVKGVILDNGSRIFADRVITAADGRFSGSTLMGRNVEEYGKSFNPAELSDQPVQVNHGVAEDFPGEDGSITYILPISLNSAGREHSKITVHSKFYDPDASPKGKSAITVFLDSDYTWWKNISKDPDRYKEEKQRCAGMVMEIIEKYHPGFISRVEAIDVSTPLTRERFTGNWMGAMQARKPDSNMIKTLMHGSPQYAVEGVAGLYRAGQWVEAWGGITTAAQSGRKAIQALCKHDGKPFVTTRP